MKKMNKKLQLNKETIAGLDHSEEKSIYGGTTGYMCLPSFTCPQASCASCECPQDPPPAITKQGSCTCINNTNGCP